MNASQRNTKTNWRTVALFAAVMTTCAVGCWNRTATKPDKPPPAPPPVASEEVVGAFFKSLAALDVEESEMAASALKKAAELAPREPALWANLAVAQMRLRDMERAAASLQRARSLANDSRRIALLHAQLLEQSGQIEQAIEQFRRIHQQWPENIAATYSLISLLAQIRSDQAEAERLSLLSDLLRRAPDNLRARSEQARIAATLQRDEELRAALSSLLRDKSRWPEPAQEYLTQASEAAQANDYIAAARSLTFFENLIKPLPSYQQSLAMVGVSSAAAVGTPLREFLVLEMPDIEAAEADLDLSFNTQSLPEAAARPDLVLALEQAGERRSTLLSLSGDSLQVGESAALPFPGSSKEANPASVAAADLNSDFRRDLILVGAEGARIFLQQEDGSFVLHEAPLEEFSRPWRSVWPLDVEADGDLDLLLSDHESPLRWIRNNGDMTFTAMADFIEADSVRQLAATDFDGDGDVDLATLDTSGAVAVWHNERGGRYVAVPSPLATPRLQLAIGDVDRDGRFDLISLLKSGEVRKAAYGADGTWSETRLTEWSAASLDEVAPGDAFLSVADVDNNGAVDVIASADGDTAIWLRTNDGEWAPLAETPPIHVGSIADRNDDGLLDLVGLGEEGAAVALNQSAAGYRWHVIAPKATTGGGDQRINPFGIGGRIEIRAGNLVQATAIQSPRVHFGLGRHGSADVARIVWPNGTVQAEFDLQANQTLVATQRLKGSCPWVFAHDGDEFRFVKDFLWRSPLGLRINAQATAGVMQTEDWIKIPHDRLAPADGRYLLRITAELWETHFFDHVSLLAVDHPANVEVVVDERFVPNAAPLQRPIVVTPPQPLQHVTDHRGVSLDDALRENDGAYADRFALGKYQGVAEEHWVEFDVPAKVDSDRQVLIIGNGWIYPTDSSLNVALAQGGAERPFGLTLEQRGDDGRWRLLKGNLGFPAGKNKDAIITLPAGSLAKSRRLRLRTNMEIYWDSLRWSYKKDDEIAKVKTLPLQVAELRHRGYSKLLPIDRRRPDTPLYEVKKFEQQWLDLEGRYTRFGDVRELLAKVDDRYVIMNAGDELVFEFETGRGLPDGWRRDFILVGDGWVKDGDFNTAFSQWVRPLPAHEQPDYAGPLTPLEEDPVYLRHADDWRVYHTRYVTPRRFQRGLWPPLAAPKHGENSP